jgi:DNA invertase Pin-like site-specific DNA recombinase
MNRAVIYCRVSTKEQVEEGNSLITQEKNCREYASKYGYEVAEVFIEMGESAKTADRTELQKLFRFCATKKNNIQAVIAYKIDRISRNTDDYSQIRLLLKRYNIEIKSTSEYFENTPAGRFMENIIANVAQFDNDVRTERSVGGMKQAMSEGRYVWHASLGYSNVRVNGKATIVPNEKAPIIKKAFELIAKRTLTVEETRKHIGKLGICKKNGRPIEKSNFYILLRNPVYMGIINKFGSECKGKFEPIISEALFNQVQYVLKRKSTSREYQIENPDFPLRRFVLSPHGRTLTGCWSKGCREKYAYYRFSGNGQMFPKVFMESKFIGFLNSFSIDEGIIEDLRIIVKNKIGDASKTKKILVDQLLLKDKQLKEKQQVLVDKNISGVLPDALFKEQLELLNTETWQVQTDLEQKKDTIVDIDFIFTRLSQMLFMPGEFWKRQPFHIKRRLQKFDFPEGIYFDGNNYRTNKISSVFKLGSALLKNYSLNVHLKELPIKQRNLDNSSILPNLEIMSLLQKVESDLILFDEILKTNTTETPELFKIKK